MLKYLVVYRFVMNRGLIAIPWIVAGVWAAVTKTFRPLMSPLPPASAYTKLFVSGPSLVPSVALYPTNQ